MQRKMRTPTAPYLPDDLALTDFYASSFLIARNQPLIGTHRRGARTVFVFSGCAEAHLLLRDFFSGRATVNARAFKDAVVNLKALIHSGQSI